MKLLRTPEERFQNLPDYDFPPTYVEIASGEGETIRCHVLDLGPNDAATTVLLLHGEPSWSYLYRHMIPGLLAQGYRVVAPDLVGFGKSDKPASRHDYTYARHVAWLSEVVFDALQLDHLTLFCQDWGGLLGLRLVAASPEKFDRVVVSNTGLPTGTGKATEAFLAWQRFSQTSEVFPIGNIVNGGSVRELNEQEIAAYDAPFPDETFKEGARQFPSLVPSSPDDPEREANERAWEQLEQFDKPFLVAFSDQDPVSRGTDGIFAKRIAGTSGQAHTTIVGGGHFLQEDCPEELVALLTKFIEGAASA
jgi:haloalkane dehalogenase